MTFHRIMTRTILQSWENSFPENLMIKFPENAKKAYMWCILQFGTICPIIRHKIICEETSILVKVTGWSAASLKLTLFLK